MARRAMAARRSNSLRWPVITAQQCAEKYRKGYPGLPDHIDFNCTSMICVYLTQRMHANAFKQAFTQLEQAARILSNYGAAVRYPMENFVDPNEEEAWEAIKLAEEVATFVKTAPDR